jgi:CDP-diacylglycerol---serine O-phosphatidyltransferase
MAYCGGFQSPAAQVTLAFYTLCSVARLARFNVTAQLTPKNVKGASIFYEGLPIPFAAIAMSTLMVLGLRTERGYGLVFGSIILPGTMLEYHVALFLVLSLGCMMTSRRLQVSPGRFGLPKFRVS